MRPAEPGLRPSEVVVASAVSALVMLATVTAFRTFGQAYQRLDQVTAETAKKREVDRFLRASLVDAMNGEARFEGNTREVSWITPLDRVGSAGGIQHLRLRRRGDNLVLSFAPFDPARDPEKSPDWGSVVDDYVLLEDVTEMRLRYLPSPQDDWSRSAKLDDDEDLGLSLPSAMMLELTASGQAWPPLTVAFDQFGRQE